MRTIVGTSSSDIKGKIEDVETAKSKLEVGKDWYSEDQIKRLVYSRPKQKPFLRYVFSFGGDTVDPSVVFINQFRVLIKLKEQLKQPVHFIAMQPGKVVSSHFIFGVMVERKLMIINPMGATQRPDFYNILKEFQEKGMIENIYISATPLQKDPNAIVSCGPICVELFNYYSSFTKEQILKMLLGASKVKYSKEGLRYTPMGIKSLPGSSLKPLLTCTPKEYTHHLAVIREKHTGILLQEGLQESCDEQSLVFKVLELDETEQEDIKKVQEILSQAPELQRLSQPESAEKKEVCEQTEEQAGQAKPILPLAEKTKEKEKGKEKESTLEVTTATKPIT